MTACAFCNEPWEPTGHWCRALSAPESTVPMVPAEDFERLARRVESLEWQLTNAIRAIQQTEGAISTIQQAERS